MISLTLAALFFVGIHVCISGTTLRDDLVRRIGEQGFRGLFSMLSLAGMVWLVQAYRGAPLIELWGPVFVLRPVALLLMLVAFVFVVVGVTTSSPTAVGGERQLESDEPARGILRVTRHPFLWGVALWAFTHLVLAGDAASVVLFGSLLVLALIGPRSIDAKRQRRFADTWERFVRRTSDVPFAAILQGRNRLHLAEIGWWRIALALALYLGMLAGHQWLFGVSPFPA